MASGAISPKILEDHSFSIPHPSAKFCPNKSSFRRDISENVFQTHYNNYDMADVRRAALLVGFDILAAFDKINTQTAGI